MGSEAATRAREALTRLVVDVPDWPEPGVVFKDITPVLADHAALTAVVAALALGAALFLAVQADKQIRGAGLYKTLLIWPYAVAPALAAVLCATRGRPAWAGVLCAAAAFWRPDVGVIAALAASAVVALGKRREAVPGEASKTSASTGGRAAWFMLAGPMHEDRDGGAWQWI